MGLDRFLQAAGVFQIEVHRVRFEAHSVGIHGEPPIAQRLPENGEGSAQCPASPVAVEVAPQQGSQRVPGSGGAAHGEIGE